MRAGVLRAGPILILASLLSGCITDGRSVQSSGNWKIERRPDRISGMTGARVYVQKMALTASGEFDTGTLQLACFNGKPIVHIAFNFRIGTNRNAFVEYRFDANPGHKPYAEILSDHRTIVIEEKAELARFLGELANASTLVVRVTSLSDPRTEVEFQVAGAPAAIETAYSSCPVPGLAATARR